MECPKCGAEIDKGTMVCPNCKKVLKIVCPVCRTVNEKNICKKCGEVLVVKCTNCGKINMMKNQKCLKCGYSTEISAVQSESNSDTFAVVKIEFPNYDVIKMPDAQTILKGINAKIRCLMNKDAQIGHSYLMHTKSAKEILFGT